VYRLLDPGWADHHRGGCHRAVLAPRPSDNDSTPPLLSSSSTGTAVTAACNITAWQNNTYNPNTDTINLYAINTLQSNQTAMTFSGGQCMWWITDYNPSCTVGQPCCWITTDITERGTVLPNIFSSPSITANLTCSP
jgi:hypothetical protein